MKFRFLNSVFKFCILMLSIKARNLLFIAITFCRVGSELVFWNFLFQTSGFQILVYKIQFSKLNNFVILVIICFFQNSEQTIERQYFKSRSQIYSDVPLFTYPERQKKVYTLVFCLFGFISPMYSVYMINVYLFLKNIQYLKHFTK